MCEQRPTVQLGFTPLGVCLSIACLRQFLLFFYSEVDPSGVMTSCMRNVLFEHEIENTCCLVMHAIKCIIHESGLSVLASLNHPFFLLAIKSSSKPFSESSLGIPVCDLLDLVLFKHPLHVFVPHRLNFFQRRFMIFVLMVAEVAFHMRAIIESHILW